MNRDLNFFAKQYLEEIYCQAAKERALAQLRKDLMRINNNSARNPHHHVAVPQVQLQDCALSPNLIFRNL